MATILIKRGLQSNIGNVSLEEGELALAYNADKTAAALYTSDGNGGTVPLNPDVSGEIMDTLNEAIGNKVDKAEGKDLVSDAEKAKWNSKLDADGTIDGGTF